MAGAQHTVLDNAARMYHTSVTTQECERYDAETSSHATGEYKFHI